MRGILMTAVVLMGCGDPPKPRRARPKVESATEKRIAALERWSEDLTLRLKEAEQQLEEANGRLDAFSQWMTVAAPDVRALSKRVDVLSAAISAIERRQSTPATSAEPINVPVSVASPGGRGIWWCTEAVDEASGDEFSSCSRTKATCADYVEGMKKRGNEYGACEPAKGAACFRYRFVISKGEVESCHKWMKHCNQHVTFIKKKAADDATLITACKVAE